MSCVAGAAANQVHLTGSRPRNAAARVRSMASRRVVSVELLRGRRTLLGGAAGRLVADGPAHDEPLERPPLAGLRLLENAA